MHFFEKEVACHCARLLTKPELSLHRKISESENLTTTYTLGTAVCSSRISLSFALGGVVGLRSGSLLVESKLGTNERVFFVRLLYSSLPLNQEPSIQELA